jgi:hypothetical protein
MGKAEWFFCFSGKKGGKEQRLRQWKALRAEKKYRRDKVKTKWRVRKIVFL